MSMRVSSVAVLENADLPCRANMCAERICIPNDIEAFCRCGDDDKSCQEENEQQVCGEGKRGEFRLLLC